MSFPIKTLATCMLVVLWFFQGMASVCHFHVEQACDDSHAHDACGHEHAPTPQPHGQPEDDCGLCRVLAEKAVPVHYVFDIPPTGWVDVVPSRRCVGIDGVCRRCYLSRAPPTAA